MASVEKMYDFFTQPILNSPYEYPSKHWELDDDGQPTNELVEVRRGAKFISPIPKPKKRKSAEQTSMVFDAEAAEVSTEAQQYDPTPIINSLRQRLDRWRAIPDPGQWGVTPETARLLQHWRHHEFNAIRPFFCQVEAAETAIWLTEVAPSHGKEGKRFLAHLADSNEHANPGLPRLALKLATGAGKTTVMAMLIAWQTINAVRRPNSKKFTRGFLIVAPGITIKDRLRVLQPNDPDSYVHRIGRTARAGASGTALSFCDHGERAYLRDIEKTIRQAVPVLETHAYHAAEIANDPGPAKGGKHSVRKAGSRRRSPQRHRRPAA